VSWQVIPKAPDEVLGDSNAECSRRPTEAMLKMCQINVDELRRAADGQPLG
jgi:predicted 3-demethylubiquinone-9 3-methyltransferase (glyoxalase superfamily)